MHKQYKAVLMDGTKVSEKIKDTDSLINIESLGNVEYERRDLICKDSLSYGFDSMNLIKITLKDGTEIYIESSEWGTIWVKK